MPWCASSVRRSRTSPTSVGSSALVTSSSSNIAGLHGEGSHDGDALLLTARETLGIVVRPILQSDALQQHHGLFANLIALAFLRPHRPKHDVVEHAEMRKEVVRLKDDADVASHQFGIDPRIHQALSIEGDLSPVDAIEKIDTSKQRGLSRTRGPDETHHLVTTKSNEMSRNTSLS